jgi:Rrf2 family protein
MLYSSACEYAIRALTRLALCEAEPAQRCRVKEIAESERIPAHFLGKIFQTLVRAGMLRSARGPGGGFTLARPAGQITLWEIVAAVDGVAQLDRCVVGLERCSDDSLCPQHHIWKPLKNQIKQYLQSTSLEETAQAVKEKRRLAMKER